MDSELRLPDSLVSSREPEEKQTGTGSINKTGGIFQALVLRTFQQMTLGCLHLQLPDGTARTIGTPGHAVSAKITITNPNAFRRCALYGDIGFGEAYVAGEWETDDLTKVISWFIFNIAGIPSLGKGPTKQAVVNFLNVVNRIGHLFRHNSVSTSRRNISEHYDLGNEFYQIWLDSTMTYSSAVFTATDRTLEEAQTEKYDRLCRNLHLKPTDHLLEIGSGWGGMACHAAKNYGCRVTTVTISQAQYDYAKARFEREGVADRVTIELKDYRLLEGQFDKVVSIEMMEALGDQYLETYFAKIHALLKPQGLVALQYITCPDSKHAELKGGVDWIQKHIFPGSLLLSVGRVNQAINRTGDLFLHRLEDFGMDYAKTLRLWCETFNERLEEIRALGFGDEFIRKWNYYLCYCEAAFAMRHISVVQAVYTRPNNYSL